jgi:hypothetical protein
MKKLILALSIGLIASFSSFAQPEVDYVPVGTNGIEQMIIEKADASSVGTDMVRYRVFIDLEADWGHQVMTGTPAIGPMTISTTGTWFNSAAGTIKGEAISSLFFGVYPDLEYDSYVTSGGTANDRIGVPYSVDPNGYIPGTPAATDITLPAGESLYMFNNSNSSDNLTIANGSIYPTPSQAVGGLEGPDPATNIIMLGQFTTDGDFEFDMNIQTKQKFGSLLAKTTVDVYYSSVPNVPPSVNVVEPVNGTNVNKNEVVTIGVHADDTDGTIDNVEFFVNGTSIGIDDTDNGQTDPALPTHTITWTAVGSTADIYAVATDNASDFTQSAPITINVNDPNPTIVSVTAPTAGNYDLNDITITADASDADEPVSEVEFLVDGSVVGTDNDGTDGWSTTYSPSEGTVDIAARAINSASVATTSAPVSVTFANAAPSVSITAPVTPFDLVVGNDTTFEATASDVDGTVTKVDFLVDGSVVATDNDGTDGFSFTSTYNAVGTKTVEARATDNNGGVTTSAPVTFDVVFPIGGPAYAIDNVVEFCSSSDVFCMPVITTRAAADVIGYDVEMKYDASKVTPTGIVTVGEDLIADRDYVSYNYNMVGDTLVRISMWINGTAPMNTSFAGEGQVFCVQFSRNYNLQVDDTAQFEAPLVAESYADYVIDQEALPGSYVMVEETEFNGSLSYWSDNSPIKYETGVNLITDIYGDVDPSEVVNPDENGAFVYNITNGETITIERDVPNTTDVQSVINAYDGYLASKVAVADPNYRPNPYQMIAMDVNLDGRIAAGDITQISQRAVGQLDEFALDWVFVTTNMMLQDLGMRISENWPQPDGSGYDRLNVPSVSDQVDLPVEYIDNCPTISSENIKGIMLGDVDGSYAAISESTELKSTASDEIVIDLSNGTISVNSKNLVYAIDIQISCADMTDANVEAIADVNITQNMIGSKLAVASRITNSNKSLNTEEAVMSLNLKSAVDIDSEDVSVPLALINGKPVDVKVIGSASGATGINDAQMAMTKVYPNPASVELNVETELSAAITIYNALNQIVYANDDAQGLTTIDVSDLAQGLYLVKVVINDDVETYSIIVE